MLYPFLAIYLIFFTYLSYQKIEYGLFLFFLLLPTYLIRFHIGFLPTTMLEAMIWILLIMWITKYHRSLILNLKSSILKHKLLFVSIAIFLLASTISIFTSSNLHSALGEWKAFYVEPALVFLMIISRNKEQGTRNNNIAIKQYNNKPTEQSDDNITKTILSALILSGFITSLLAIYQHFTGFMVPYAFWENRNTYRVTAWYGFPNGVGLFLAPLFPFALFVIKQNYCVLKERLKNKDSRLSKQSSIFNLQSFSQLLYFTISILFVPTSILAIVFAKSTGALIGIAVGIGFLLLVNKKTRWLTVVIGLVSIVSVVSLASLKPIKDELLFQDRSGQIRLSIYKETINLFKDHPIVGAGLASYSEKIAPYHTLVNGERIEIFHHPHNIFLTMWVNLGLLGLIGFILLLISFFKLAFKTHDNKTTFDLSSSRRIKQYSHTTIFLTSSMITLLTTGLVDSPYIKNDLAILFWTIIALLVIYNAKKN